MLMLWLADKVLDAVGDDELSYDAITVAQEQIQKGAQGLHILGSLSRADEPVPHDFAYYKISNAIAAHASASAKAW